jgi:DNA-binding transcriptional LysR family regulator
MSVSLRLLRVFLAVSREGNVGRAAAALYVSQPSLSQDIRRLERELGTQLFVRGPQGVSLTPAGAAFRRDVEDALHLIDRAVAEAQATGAATQQRLVLGFTPSIGHQLLPSLLPVLERRIKGVVLDEREVDTGGVGQGVRSGAFDLGLAHCVEHEDGLVIETIRHEPMSVALSVAHPLAVRGEPVRLAQLAGLPMMLWARELAPSYHDTLVEICTASGLEPALVPGPRRAMIRSYAVSEGKVFCLLPRSTSILSIPGVAFLDVADAGAVLPLQIVRRASDDRHEVAEVWRVMSEEAGERD